MSPSGGLIRLGFYHKTQSGRSPWRNSLGSRSGLLALRINDPSGEIAGLREYRLLSILFFSSTDSTALMALISTKHFGYLFPQFSKCRMSLESISFPITNPYILLPTANTIQISFHSIHSFRSLITFPEKNTVAYRSPRTSEFQPINQKPSSESWQRMAYGAQ